MNNTRAVLHVVGARAALKAISYQLFAGEACFDIYSECGQNVSTIDRQYVAEE